MSTNNVLLMVAKTSTGMVREHNEDNFISTDNINGADWYVPQESYNNPPNGSLMAVADGMGGLNAGEVASRVAIESVKQYFSKIEPKGYKDEKVLSLLKAAVLQAHKAILEKYRRNPEMEEMGTTLIIGWILNGKLFVGWTGDSRCYYFRESTGLRQLSKDHSYVQTLVDEGKITAEQAFFHPQNNIVTQSLGDREREPEPDTALLRLAKDDILLLCSDGLSGMLTDVQIEEIIRGGKDNIAQCTDELIAKANAAGGVDNITVVLSKVLEGRELTKEDKEEQQVIPGPIDKKKKKRSRLLAFAALFSFIVLAAFGVPLIFFNKPSEPLTPGGKDSVHVKSKTPPLNHDPGKAPGTADPKDDPEGHDSGKHEQVKPPLKNPSGRPPASQHPSRKDSIAPVLPMQTPGDSTRPHVSGGDRKKIKDSLLHLLHAVKPQHDSI